MEYKTLAYTDLAVCVRLSQFTVEHGVNEYNLIVECTDPTMPCRIQIQSLVEGFDRALATLDADAKPVFKRYLLSDPTNQAEFLPKAEHCAVSVIGQAPLNGTKAALWAYVQTGMDVRRQSNGLWRASHGHYKHLWCGGASAPDLHSEIATMALFGDYVIQLDNEHCRLLDNCMRTWFFVRDIDVNYRGVVVGRNDVFRRSGLTPLTHFIASTGIAGSNANTSVSVTMDAYAVSGIVPQQVTYLKAADFLNSTVEYGVAFERGTAIQYGDRRHILISGTASINNKGEVMYPGDIVAQTDRMIRNVEALIVEGGATLADLTHIIVYLRDTADYAVVSDLFQSRFGSVPCTIVLAPVCRPGWLIEMECMAFAPIADTAYAPM